MIKYFSKAFKLTNENIILTTPLLLFIMIFSLYLGFAHNLLENLSYMILLGITTLFMLAAFCAGWFYMIKKSIDLDKIAAPEEEKAKLSFGLMKEIPTGIGEYFLSFVFGIFLYFALIILFVLLTSFVGLHLIGKVNLSLIELKAALSSSAHMKSFISTLPTAELIKLNSWNFLILTSMTAFSFITMFWATEIICKTKNAFLAFFKSLSFIFRNFLSSVILFIYVSLVNFSVSLINAACAVNPILYFISTLLYFYFVVYIVVLIFLYYDNENLARNTNEPDTKTIEQTQSDSDSGADSIGQEQSGDSDSQGT